MEMEVPVENNINIGNGISNIMPLHNASRGPQLQPQLIRSVRSESRDRDLNMSGDVGGYAAQPTAGHGPAFIGPPSYGTGVVSSVNSNPPYYNVTSNGGIPPSAVASAHPSRIVGESSVKPSGAGDASSHRDKEREIIRETLGNRQPPMVKIAVVGESTVGKSTVCKVFTSETDTFSKNYTMTCGVDIFAKYIKMPAPFNFGGSSSSSNSNPNNMEEGVNLVLMDSSGKDIYFDLLPRYWDKIDGVVVMVDLTSASSLENAQRWLDLAKSSLSSPEKQKMLVVLIGNKMDLTEQRIISPKMAKDFAIQYNLEYFECSAKEGSGLEEPFFYLAYQWTTRLESSGNGGPVRTGGMSSSGNKEQNNREKGGISAVGSSRHSAFQRKGSSNTNSHQSQGSMDFI